MSPGLQTPAAAGESPPVPGRKIDPVRSMRAHAAIALIAFVAITGAGFPIAWKKGRSTYAAQAAIFISPRFLKNLDDDKEFELQSNTQYREFVQQNVRTIDRFDIVADAIDDLSKSGHPWRHPHESLDHAVARLQGALKILPVPDTYQITVRLEGEKPEGLAETVNAIADVFLRKSKDEDFYDRDRRTESLQREAQQLSDQISSLGRQKDELAKELAVSVFSESFSNPFDQLLVGSKQALAAARQRRIASEAQLAALQHKGSETAPTGLQAYAGDIARKDADLTSLQANLNLRRSQLLSRLDGMLPNHPGRVEIENELHQIDQIAEAKRISLEHSYAAALLAQRQSEARADLRSEQELQKQVDQQAVQAAWYSHNYQSGINIRYEIERSRNRLQAVENRMDFVEQESRAPGFARLFSGARRPTEPSSGGHKKPVLMLMVLASVLSVALPLGMDYMDPRLLSVNDVERALKFPAIGVTLSSEKNLQDSEGIRRLAAGVARDVERNGSRSFLFVPVNAEALVTPTISALAVELARLGHEVRVIDAGVQQPSAQAATAGIGHGGSSFSTQTSSFGDTRKRVRESVAQGALVLVPAKPLSEDAETELLASACDVVVVTVGCSHTKKAEISGLLRTLSNLQPRAVACVVTGFDPEPPLPEWTLSFRKARPSRLKIPQQRAQDESQS